ncbi:MAG: universal stress protein [Flavobacteriales bacterium]|nr:universal stress protein [Flavobacteriales bacterium]
MEYILVPTDFSKNAFNALEYAIDVAKLFDAKIIVLHTYEIPAGGASSLKNISYKLKEFAEEEIVRLHNSIVRKGLNDIVSIEFDNLNTDVVTGIRDMVETNDIGLVIMGTAGASGLKEIFLGSNTSEVIKNISCPVIAVPKNASFKKIENIIFATDFDMSCENENIPLIIDLTKRLNARLTMVNIQTVGTDFAKTRDNADKFFEKCEDALKEINYDYHYIIDEDITNGINKAYKNNNADLLVMIKKSHGLIDYLFNKSMTKSVVSDAKLPLLTIMT